MKMSFVKIELFFILMVILFCTGVNAGDDIADTSKRTQWEETARNCGLSSEDIDRLNKNRILISNETYKQIFSAYTSGERPLFITTDSLINAYHVLYEESILRLENTLAGKLPGILKLILENIHDADRQLKGNPELAFAAKQHAMLTIGIALKLVDSSFQFEDTKLNSILSDEVNKITEAKAIVMPEWLGKPDASFTALDYSCYKPRGFYLRSERLERYFRAVSWLQTIPFRLKNDIELLSILMLGNSADRIRFRRISEEIDFENFFRAYNFFIGVGDDWDLITAKNYVRKDLQMDLEGNDLRSKRAQLQKRAEEYSESAMINDQIRFPPGYPANVTQPQFRIISPYRTPDAILFQRTTGRQHLNRPYPNGLEVATSLGSSFAKENLVASGEKDLLREIDSFKPYFKYQTLDSEYLDEEEIYFWELDHQSLYTKYLYVLKALLDNPEPEAPDFMKTKAWEAKNCNTVLSGWAQLRHTWVLQAKQSAHWLGMTSIPIGFVEPDPEFFLRMAGLANTTREFLKNIGAFDHDYGYIIQALEVLREFLVDVKDENDTQKFFSKLYKLSQEKMVSDELLSELLNIYNPKASMGSEEQFRERIQWVDTLIKDMKNKKIDKYPELNEVIKEEDIDLRDLWDRFERVSRRLEAIAHKQLRNVDLNTDEALFIRSYGKTIAKIMLNNGNSYLSPRDDSPRIVDVYANPQTGGYLHVGIARPRKLYVLYPWKGETVLCEGAIMPYCEFVAAERLTDESWKEKLNYGNNPPVPKWLSPVITEGGVRKPNFKKGE
ncbi:MAG: DUF3160 domain-containing protein [Syntrophaceae bacterium]|nr:DUF3160 domain-containing protein [Syntrophaceae bacterium]